MIKKLEPTKQYLVSNLENMEADERIDVIANIEDYDYIYHLPNNEEMMNKINEIIDYLNKEDE